MEDIETDTLPVQRFKKRWVFGAVLLVLLIALAVIWLQRIHLADRAIRDRLDAAGIQASFDVKEIGFRTERLENIVLGDPKNPDLTAHVVEVDVAIGFGTPAIRAVRAQGVRLHGRLMDGTLSFGALDKFRDLQSTAPLQLPNVNLSVKDTQLSLATPWGGVGIALSGSGHLQNGFMGHFALRAPAVDSGKCKASSVGFDGQLQIRNRQPELAGPMTAAFIACAEQGLKLSGPVLKGKVKLSESLNNWVSDMDFAANEATLSGHRFSNAAGKINFYGNAARTDFDLTLVQAGYRGNDVAVTRLLGDAKGRVSSADPGLSISARGDVSGAGASYTGSALNGLRSIISGTKATPIGPVIAALEPALRKAIGAFDAKLAYDISLDPGNAPLIGVSGLRINARSGVQIAQAGSMSIAGAQVTGPVSMSLSGGGLPNADIALRPQQRGWAGTLALAPFTAGGASLALPKLAFTGGAGQPWRFNGQALLSGPLMGGRIDGLSLPVDGGYAGGTFSMLSGCRQVRFARVQTGAFMLPGQMLQACGQSGAILTAGRSGTRFALRSPLVSGKGKLGSTAMAFAGSNVRFDLNSGFVASNVTVDLGRADALTQLTMAQLAGRFASGGLSGTILGGAGKIGNVPLLIEQADGNWGWNNGALSLNAAARVSDAAQVDRFKTLTVPDMQIALENNVITAIGHLHEPKTGIRIADVDIRHELSSATGRALLAVDGLMFNNILQPDMLTPLTVGAIANVNGSVSGDGRIEWSAAGVKSSGRFGTKALDFAAAFGPVTGLSTDVVFTDLLGLQSAPLQMARIAVANPGIPAFDGQISYHLLPDQQVQIEGGRWPFYGGELILEPTVLDFDVAKARKLTFRLVGMDAEKFLAGYELENIRVSGVFDGTLPMIFDSEGGRIVGGSLKSRAGGGELSYLGQLSYEEMGAMANFAFEALRAIRFEDMQIGVNGNIGGEVVTEVQFKGLQQGSAARRNYITKQLAKLPIQFNVRIQAEFLSLFGSLRSLYDAEYAAQRYKGLLDAGPPITGEEVKKP
jgi:translocation and assembly module TamB